MANQWQWNVVTVDEIWAQFQLLCLVLERLCRLSLTSTTEAQVLGNRARGLLAIWREEEIAYVAGFFLKDIQNLKGKVDADLLCISCFYCHIYVITGNKLHLHPYLHL